MHTITQLDKLVNVDINPELMDQLKEYRRMLEQQKYKELFIATKMGIVEGVAISWLNHFHPTAKYIKFFTVEPIQMLLEAVLQSMGEQNKIMFSCWEDEHEKIKMAEKVGFQLFRQTYIETFPIAMLLAKLESIQAVSKVKSLAQVLQNQREAFLTELKRNYEETHLHNPAQNFSWQEWEEFLFDDEVDTALSSVLMEDEQITGYIMLHPVTVTHYEIGWIGQREQEHIQALFKQQLLALQKKGIQTVEIEVDTTDWHAMKLFSFLDLRAIKSWNSYLLLK
ncbi:hypothetical protein [Metasolibacillus meyeri]|uniref:hypothetical protein n=1 Tax=Metasolibacillus meyeri TaxID=1071052 RepID=UPI000D2FF624|nr:hypothetical protein [Metasolibacillus meyeri]